LGHERGATKRSGSPWEQYNPRHAWAEAEIFLFIRLQSGYRPEEIKQSVRAELSITPIRGYRHAFLRAIVSQLVNLGNSGSFRGLPSMRAVQLLEMDKIKRLRFQIMMRNRLLMQLPWD